MPSGEIFTGPVEDTPAGPAPLRLPGLPRRPRARRDRAGIRRRQGRLGAGRRGGRLPPLDARPRPRRRSLGELGIGLNYGIDRFTGSILYDEKIGGTVHLALGQSYPETGGDQRVGPALGPDRRHPPGRPDHGRRRGRDGRRALAGRLIAVGRTGSSVGPGLGSIATRGAIAMTTRTRWPAWSLASSWPLAGGVAPGQGSDAALKDRVAHSSSGSTRPRPRRRRRREVADRARPARPAAPAARSTKAKAEPRPSGSNGSATALARPRTTDQPRARRRSRSRARASGSPRRSRPSRRRSGNSITDLREPTGARRPTPRSTSTSSTSRSSRPSTSSPRRRASTSTSHRRRLDRPDGRRDGRPAGTPAMAKPMVVYSGPFRVQFKQIAIVRDFARRHAHGQRPVRGRLGAPAPADAPGAQGRGAQDRRRPGQGRSTPQRRRRSRARRRPPPREPASPS